MEREHIAKKTCIFENGFLRAKKTCAFIKRPKINKDIMSEFRKFYQRKPLSVRGINKI